MPDNETIDPPAPGTVEAAAQEIGAQLKPARSSNTKRGRGRPRKAARERPAIDVEPLPIEPEPEPIDVEIEFDSDQLIPLVVEGVNLGCEKYMVQPIDDGDAALLIAGAKPVARKYARKMNLSESEWAPEAAFVFVGVLVFAPRILEYMKRRSYESIQSAGDRTDGQRQD